MRHHRAFGVNIDQLDVVIVDDSRPIQTILRSILHSFRVERVRVFDNAEDALQSMLVDPPHLLITDWNMKPTDGLTLIRTMRDPRAGPVALVPAIVVTAHATRPLIEASVRSGAHYVVAKPLAPQTILKRMEALTIDRRCFVLDKAVGGYRLEGQEAALQAQRERWAKLTGVHAPAIREIFADRGSDASDRHSISIIAPPANQAFEAIRARAAAHTTPYTPPGPSGTTSLPAARTATTPAAGLATAPGAKPPASKAAAHHGPTGTPSAGAGADRGLHTAPATMVERLGAHGGVKVRRPKAAAGQPAVQAS